MPSCPRARDARRGPGCWQEPGPRALSPQNKPLRDQLLTAPVRTVRTQLSLRAAPPRVPSAQAAPWTDGALRLRPCRGGGRRAGCTRCCRWGRRASPVQEGRSAPANLLRDPRRALGDSSTGEGAGQPGARAGGTLGPGRAGGNGNPRDTEWRGPPRGTDRRQTRPRASRVPAVSHLQCPTAQAAPCSVPPESTWSDFPETSKLPESTLE